MRNNAQKVSMVPRSHYTPPVSKCVFYKFHEGSGASIADALGNGPTFTINTGTPLQTTGGYKPTAANSTVYATAAANAYLFSLLSLVGSLGELLIGYDYQSTINAIGAQQWFFQAGVSDGGASSDGCIIVGANTAENHSFSVRGISTSSLVTASGTGTPFATTNRITNVISLRNPSGGDTADITFYSRNGNTIITNSTTLNLAGNSTWAHYGSADDHGYTIGARRTSTNTYDQHQNGNAADGATISHLLMFRSDELVAGLATKVLAQMHQFPGEFPLALAGL